MKITKDNLSNVIFENHDAKILIEDVVTHTTANLYYYGEEISVMSAIDIWKRAYKATQEESVYSMSFLKSDSFTHNISLAG